MDVIKFAKGFMVAVVSLGVLSIAPLAHAAAGDRATLFFDDFEQANFAKWQMPISPNWEVNFGSLAGIYGADVEGNTDGNDAIVRSVSTLGYNNIEVSYRFKADNLENNSINNDAVRVQYSIDGGRTWSTIYAIADGEDDHIDGTNLGLYHKFHALPANASNNANFAIRFDPQLIGGPDEVWIDDVMVRGTEMGGTTPPPPANPPVPPPAPVPPPPSPLPPPPATASEYTYAECNDGIDNDKDGTTDVYDIGCLNFRQTVKIITRVVGGSLTPADFSADVMLGTTVLSGNIRGTAGGTEVTRPESGMWKIVTNTQPNYTRTFTGDCDASGLFAMGFNMYKTCTITQTHTASTPTTPPTPPPSTASEHTYAECNDGIDNDKDGATDVYDIGCLDFRQTLKIITNVSGGALPPGDFSIKVRFNPNTETPVMSGKSLGEEVTNPTTSTWQILPFEKVGYTTTFGGDCSVSGAIGMAFNLYKTCTITWFAL